MVQNSVYNGLLVLSPKPKSVFICVNPCPIARVFSWGEDLLDADEHGVTQIF